MDAPTSVGQRVQEGNISYLVVVVSLAVWVENRWIGVPMIAQGRVKRDTVANFRTLAPFYAFRKGWRAASKGGKTTLIATKNRG